MKRIPQSRPAPTSYVNRLAKLIPQQAAYHAARARNSDRAKIAASGTSAMLYQRVHGGLPCTCGITDYETVLDDDGQLTPEAMKQIANDVFNPDRGLEVYHAIDIDNPGGIDDPLTPDTDESIDVDVPGEIDILGLDQARCAVCFGTGFVPGYMLANGMRAALTPGMKSGGNFEIDQQQRPHVAIDGTFVEFEAAIPLREVLFRVWTPDAVPHYIEAAELPEPGARGTIRFNTDLDWTHFEMVSVGSAIPIDMSTTHSETMSETEYVSADFNVPADFRVNFFSIIIEDRTGNVWQVNSITPTKDNMGATIFQSVTARQVRSNELTALLIGPNTSTSNRLYGTPVVGSGTQVVVDQVPVAPDWVQKEW